MIRSCCAQLGSLFVGSLFFINRVEIIKHGIMPRLKGAGLEAAEKLTSLGIRWYITFY
jgi:hypothetical protein